MAENKKSFVMYADLIHTVEKLPDNKAGKLFKHILEYVNDRNPQTDDIMIQIAFEPVKQQLKRDLKKFEAKREQWSEAGKKSAEIKKQRKSTESTDVENVATKSTVNVSVNGTANVSVTDINTPKGEKHFQHIEEFFSLDYEKQQEGFRNNYTQKEYQSFQKFLTAMLKEFRTELIGKFDKCISIGDWKKYLAASPYLVVRPFLVKAIGASDGDRNNMAARIATYSNGAFDAKVFIKAA